MNNQLKKILPWVALVGLLLGLALLVTFSTWRTKALVDTGETRRSAEATLSRLLALSPSSMDDQAFQQAVKQAGSEPYMVYLWLFAPDGRLVLNVNSPFSQGSVGQRATTSVKQALEALPEQTLPAEQRTALEIASAIQGGGDHNDVFHYQVLPVKGQDGVLSGYLAAAYEINPQVGGAPSLGIILMVLGVPLGLGLYWLSLPIWVFLDAKGRGERAWVWAMFVLIGNLVALFAYILARAPLHSQ